MSYAVRNDNQGWRAVNGPEDVGPDEFYSVEQPAPKALTLADAVGLKKTDIAAYRYDKEVGGITMANGMKVSTDDRSKGLIAGARIDIIDDPTILTEFKAETGWIQIDAVTVTMISSAVAAHVRTCFAVEKQHSDAIDALAELPATTVADIEAYDITTGWSA